MVGAGVNAVSLPVLNLGISESAVVGYSGGDIMSPWMLSCMYVFEEPGVFSKRSGRSTAMSVRKSERYMVWCGEVTGWKKSRMMWE